MAYAPVTEDQTALYFYLPPTTHVLVHSRRAKYFWEKPQELRKSAKTESMANARFRAKPTGGRRDSQVEEKGGRAHPGLSFHLSVGLTRGLENPLRGTPRHAEVLLPTPNVCLNCRLDPVLGKAQPYM